MTDAPVYKSGWLSELRFAEAWGDFSISLPSASDSSSRAVREQGRNFVANVVYPLLRASSQIVLFDSNFDELSFGGCPWIKKHVSQLQNRARELHTPIDDEVARGTERFWMDLEREPTRRGNILFLIDGYVDQLENICSQVAGHAIVENLGNAIGKRIFREARTWALKSPSRLAIHSLGLDYLHVFAQAPLITAVLKRVAEAELGKPLSAVSWSPEPDAHLRQVLAETERLISSRPERRMRK